MKKAIPVLAVMLLCLACSARAADDFMIKWINWNEYADSEKIRYIEGLYDGAMFYKTSTGHDVPAADIYPYDLEPWDAMKAIDEFYKDEKNRYVPVAYALTIVNMQNTGKADIEINAYKEKIRQELAQ